jgi:hypothetical protein
MAITIALLLFAVALAPLALAAWRPALAPGVIGLVATIILAWVFIQTGVPQRNRLASTDVSGLFSSTAFSDRCEQVMDALIEARVASARPGPAGLVVNGAAWDRLPRALQEPILSCAQQLADPENPTNRIEIIRH